MQTPTYRMGFSSQELASLQPWSAALSSFNVTGRGSKAPLNAFLCSPLSIGFGDSHSACNFIQPSRCPLMPCALSQRTADLRIRATGLGIGGVQSLYTRMSSLAGVSQIQCWPIRHTCPLKFPHLKLWLLSAFQLCKPLNHKEKEKDASNLQARSEMKSANVPGAPALINEDGQNVTLSPRSETMESSAPVQSLLNGLGSPSAVPQQTLLKDDSMDKDSKPELGPSLCITVIGATGELARSKIFPALFALYYNGCLPKNVSIFGYSRSDLSTEDLRIIISENLTCRVDHQEDCGDTTLRFLERVHYQCGGYESCEGMCKLDSLMRQQEGDNEANRIFYLSVPQDVLLEVASCVAANAQSKKGWTRVIVEKPFGHDSESSAILTKGLLANLSEHQIYRIDHLLGKELTENLTVLRFSNLVFEPLWSRTYIRNVQVIVSEDWGLEGRGRYFDKHGIIRDIVQTHIMQTIALFAMEPPVSLDGEDIRNEKVKVLRSMRKPTLHDVVLGQYKASISKDGKSKIPGFLDEVDVSPNSLTPTFVAAVLYIDNARWDGVPFLIKAGIGMIKHRVEIRIQFRHVPGNLYRERFGYNIDLATNELVLQIQPDESILLKINNKVPGLGLQLDSSELNLLYRDKYNSEIPDSYEHLILGVIDGDNKLFIRSDELQATWDLLTPLLEEIETHKVAPELYQFGGRGPVGAYYLGAMHGVRWADD